MKNKGLLIVVSGPSGVGKGTVVKELIKQSENMHLSVSATTREKRPGEEHGVNYYYMTVDEFEKLKKEDGFLENAVFCDNYYGTPKRAVLDKIESGIDVVLEIEVKGAMQVRSKYPEGVYVLLVPPSMQELEDRLRGRQTEDDETIKKRLAKAKEEMGHFDRYNYVVVNDEVEKATENLKAVIKAEKLRIERNIEIFKESELI